MGQLGVDFDRIRADTDQRRAIRQPVSMSRQDSCLRASLGASCRRGSPCQKRPRPLARRCGLAMPFGEEAHLFDPRPLLSLAVATPGPERSTPAGGGGGRGGEPQERRRARLPSLLLFPWTPATCPAPLARRPLMHTCRLSSSGPWSAYSGPYRDHPPAAETAKVAGCLPSCEVAARGAKPARQTSRVGPLPSWCLEIRLSGTWFTLRQIAACLPRSPVCFRLSLNSRSTCLFTSLLFPMTASGLQGQSLGSIGLISIS